MSFTQQNEQPERNVAATILQGCKSIVQNDNHNARLLQPVFQVVTTFLQPNHLVASLLQP